MKQDKYMTITALSVEKNGTITYAGLHQDLIIYRKKTSTVEIIETDGMWIGMFDDIGDLLKNETIVLGNDDVLLLFTDGITEAWSQDSIINKRNIKDDMFGEKRLIEIMKKNGHLSTDKISSAILKAHESYVCNDDVAFIVLKKL